MDKQYSAPHPVNIVQYHVCFKLPGHVITV